MHIHLHIGAYTLMHIHSYSHVECVRPGFKPHTHTHTHTPHTHNLTQSAGDLGFKSGPAAATRGEKSKLSCNYSYAYTHTSHTHARHTHTHTQTSHTHAQHTHTHTHTRTSHTDTDTTHTTHTHTHNLPQNAGDLGFKSGAAATGGGETNKLASLLSADKTEIRTVEKQKYGKVEFKVVCMYV
jgi:hypothetical protein